MKYAPLLNTMAILACGFALGAYFYHVMPGATEPVVREIASQKKVQKYNEQMSIAFKDCLQDSVREGKLQTTKVSVDGRNWPVMSLDCVGDKAKALYDELGPYSDEQFVRYSDGRRGIARFFGRLYPPSQCAKVTRNARGAEMNLYSCSIRLDLAQELVQEYK